MLPSTVHVPSREPESPSDAPDPLSSSVWEASSMLASSGASSRIRNHQPAKPTIASTTITPPPISNVRLDRAM
jgi:hypothetical protein